MSPQSKGRRVFERELEQCGSNQKPEPEADSFIGWLASSHQTTHQSSSPVQCPVHYFFIVILLLTDDSYLHSALLLIPFKEGASLGEESLYKFKNNFGRYGGVELQISLVNALFNIKGLQGVGTGPVPNLLLWDRRCGW